MTGRIARVHFVVPGSIRQRTGGYLYDARTVAGLGAIGWDVTVHELDGAFPGPGPRGRDALDAALAALPDGARVVIDGLAMGALPDVVRSHAGRLHTIALVHHPLCDETGLERAEADRLFELEREALAHVAGIIVTSPYTVVRLQDFGVPPGRIRDVVPGTEPAPIADGPAAGAPPALLCVGTVSPRKGQEILVRALDRVRDLAWSCACPGSLDRAPEYAAGVLEQTRARGLDPRIDFPGELDADRLDRYYRSASLFVLPSFYEGYGMALTEAMARGLPVVSTTGGAIPHTVPSGVGLLVEPGDVEALAAVLRDLLAGPERREALAERARAHARNLPTWDEQARRFGHAVLELTHGG